MQGQPVETALLVGDAAQGEAGHALHLQGLVALVDQTYPRAHETCPGDGAQGDVRGEAGLRIGQPYGRVPPLPVRDRLVVAQHQAAADGRVDGTFSRPGAAVSREIDLDQGEEGVPYLPRGGESDRSGGVLDGTQPEGGMAPQQGPVGGFRC